ncbi:ectonucleotide pyrophosphatase/phosphodiesterase [Listeria ilorinensis]|uniref:alkaline phosphatase family protein n=1 Tax=Listeria ilorinensis TaxID=2867439 RepID=UPI001EF4AB06|nr:ectonucleotide pyrophosphatase/phosphodiesterase [Listeria ilorinensis]
MSQYLIVLSLDALGAEDLEDLSELDAIAELIEKGVHIKQVESIYPSLTYPAHTSIITGHYPKTHGIVNNTKIEPGKASPDWFWFKKSIRVPTLYDKAKEAGLKTAAFLWPVAAKSGIDYNIAEIFPNRFWLNQVVVSLWGSSPRFLLEMNKKFGHLRKGIEQPELDHFLTEAVVDTILHKQPRLLLAHFVDMDSMRHAYGVQSKEAKEALKRHNTRVRRIIEATKEAGIYDETTFVILGDHYQIDVDTAIRLNVLLREMGYIETNQNGEIISWQAYAKSTDGSSYIYCKDPSICETLQQELIKVEGIERILTRPEIIEKGADPEACFMVEGKPGYFFMEQLNGELIEKVLPEKVGEPDYYKAVHGYDPKKENYQTTLVIAGPKIKQHTTFEKARLIDEGPTFARILGLDLPDAEGRVLEEIFNTQ